MDLISSNAATLLRRIKKMLKKAVVASSEFVRLTVCAFSYGCMHLRPPLFKSIMILSYFNFYTHKINHDRYFPISGMILFFFAYNLLYLSFSHLSLYFLKMYIHPVKVCKNILLKNQISLQTNI